MCSRVNILVLIRLVQHDGHFSGSYVALPICVLVLRQRDERETRYCQSLASAMVAVC